ncbi:hypothetical protein FJMB80055_36640 [Enterobacter hormaechei]|nr:hypothetical protein OIPHN069_04560 [Enterobacter hormaechei subsp. hoffmannii]BDI76785.1 hypothetical protein FJMB80001_04560 [Enterobacter hormaechei]GJJ92930.1 hypothetical protein TUM16654_12100 [Enterobacter cloacae]BDI81748.1 hypothetical protein FJMB80002_04560 [Enterobacter hormaechei]BDI86652.1 hypothetical protein FJMB80003_04600 [Enterobacter hormaechei]
MPTQAYCVWAAAAVASIESEATSRVRVCMVAPSGVCGVFPLTLTLSPKGRGDDYTLSPLGRGLG